MVYLQAQFLAAVFLIYAFNIFLPGSIQQDKVAAALAALIVLGLFGSGVLATVADVDKWRDEGIVSRTIRVAMGAVMSSWIFEGGLGNASALDRFPKSITSFDFALHRATSAVGNLRQSFPRVRLGMLPW